MELSQNWLTEGLLDFEYKKYLLLAYLQRIDQNFAAAKLYPPYQDLFTHYQNILQLHNNKQNIINSFPKRLVVDNEAVVPFAPKSILVDDAMMQELQDIIAFSVPEFEKYLEDGRNLYHLVQDQLTIDPIGLLQLNNDLGFFMIQLPNQRELPVYKYHLTIYESSGEGYRGVNIQYLESIPKTLAQTYENLKFDISKRYFSQTVPGGYLVSTKMTFPMAETLLPVTKRALVRYIST